MFTIRAETASDSDAVTHLTDLGFGPDHRSRTVWRLRQGPAADGLGFVAADAHEGRVLATVRFWPVEIGEPLAAVLLGPLAVCPTLRGQGLGRALVAHGLQAARDAGWDLCLVSGAPEFYRPFGFEPAPPYGFAMPGPVNAGWLQVRPLRTGALDDLPAAETRPIQPRRWVRRAGVGLGARAAAG